MTPSTPEMTCACCGNRYAKSMTIVSGGRSFTFDCFECAIHVLAPTCAACGCRVVGHGVEGQGEVYCCASCARRKGELDVSDRAYGAT